MDLRVTIPGRPQPKQRARTYRDKRSGKVRTVTPKRTGRWEKHAGLMLLSARPGDWPLDERYGLSIHVVWSSHRPDLSNVLKAVEDAGNGIVYKDDRQVEQYHDCSIRKAGIGEPAEVEVHFWTVFD